MPVTVDQYLKSLGDSGIMSPQEVAALQRRIPPDERGQDAKPLAAGLVRMGRLTNYQAASVYHGKAHALVMGNYLLLDKLGQGDHGVVYKAQHREKGLLVAVKVLLASRLNSPEAVERLQRQVNEAKQLEHPNLVTLFGVAESQEHYFLVMECIEGRDFTSLLEEQGTLPLDLAVDSIVQAGRALEYGHAKGVMHGDIKPSHLLLTADRMVKLVDVGLAYDDDAPSERSDVTALGHTLYTLVTGKPARPEDGKPASLLDRKDVPRELEAVYQKMVANDSEHQYGSMSEVLADLQPVSDAIAPVHCETTDLLATLMKDASVSAELFDQPLEPVHHQAKTPAHPPRPHTGHGVMTQQGVVFLSIGIIAAIGLLGAVFWAIFGGSDTQQVAQTAVTQKQDESPAPVVEPKPEVSVAKPTATMKEGGSAAKPGPAPKPEAPNEQKAPSLPAGDADRRVAQWFLAEKCGGIVAKLTDEGGNTSRSMRALDKPEDIPSLRFAILILHFRSMPGDRQKLLDLHDLQRLERVGCLGRVFDDGFAQLLQGIPNLRYVSFSNSSISDTALVHLKAIPGLSGLLLQQNRGLTSAGCRHLASLRNLEKLSLSRNGPRLSGVISDAELTHIARLTKLKDLSVGSDALSDSGLRTVSSLRGLVKLRFSSRNVTDDGLIPLGGLKSLKELDISGEFTGRGLAHVAKHDLMRLVLRSTDLTDSAAPYIVGMKNLESLVIMSSRITDTALEQVAKLSRLRSVTLFRCSDVTDVGAKHLSRLKALEYLDLRDTKVTQKAVSDLKRALPKCNILSGRTG